MPPQPIFIPQSIFAPRTTASVTKLHGFFHSIVPGWCYAALFLSAVSAFQIRAAEVIPAAPKRYFNDYAQVVSSAAAARLNTTLEDFERATSNQLVVAVFPKMQSDSSIEDYTVRVAQSWKVGQKGTANGAVLFVFIQDRKMYLQVGYGLEGALPDALAKQIIENEIKPRFKSGDYEGGLSAGVSAIIAATRSEYKGSGTTIYQRQQQRTQRSRGLGVFGVFFILMIILAFAGRRRKFGRRGWFDYPGGWVFTGGGFPSGRGGGGGGGGFSGGGGGFSGGGGSFGGGGAGGSW